MKNYTYLLLAAATLLTFSCAKEIEAPVEAPTNSHVVFKTSVEKIDSKATITANVGDSEFTSAWVETDQVNLYAKSGTFDEEKPATWNANKSAFEADFETSVPVDKEAWTYKAKYPYDADGDIPFGSARTQNGNNYNSAYDVMYGTVSYSSAYLGQDNSGNVFVIPMERLTGIAYFHITGGDSEADVLSATLTVNSGNIAAENVRINNDGTAVTPTNGTNNITISFPEGQRPKANDIKLWFNVLPGDYSGMKLVIKTASKTASIASNTTMTYTAGEINKVVLSGLNWVDYESHRISWDEVEDWSSITGGFELIDGNYTVDIVKAPSGTTPTINSTALDARAYAGATVTVAFDGLAMSKIVFNLSSQGRSKLAAISASVGTISTQSSSDYTVVWTGKASSVVFTVGPKATYGSNPSDAGQLCFESIDIETLDDGLIDPSLAFGVASCNAITNASFDAPELTNTHNVSVTYSSSNTSVATVNPTTGNVSIVATGSTVIRASFAGDATYRASAASYELTVAAPSIGVSSTTPAKASYLDNSEVSFNVTANCTWEAVKGTDVNNIIKSVNVSENTVTVRFNANTEESEKTATVNLNQTDADSSPVTVPVTVTQIAKPGTAERDAIIWSESFSDLSANATPSLGTVALYGGGWASYSYNPSRTTIYTKVYTSGGPGTGNNLLLSYSSRSDEYWAVTGIPTAGWDSFTLSYKANTSLSVEGTSGVTIKDISVDGNTYVKKLSVSGSPVTFGITFINTQASNNARIDDVVLTAGAPIPSITVSTSAASSTESATGTTATLNGVLSLVNGAENGDVTGAGFYYKLSSSGSYTKVTLDAAPTSTTSFSYNLTELAKDEEYTYYAWAVYDSGDEVTGKATEKTFTPTQTEAPASGTVMWSETWTGASTGTSANDSLTPSANNGPGTTVYGGGSVVYTQSANSVYVRNENTGGGTAPELLLSSGKTWTISNIPTGGASTLDLTYVSNNTKSSVSVNTDGASISGSSKSYTITTGGANTISITFSSSANTRIDNIYVKVH